ncbi:MAG: acyl--CoA ligase [Thermoclostridium sp.]|nr:acyl--CoA ligase [Thermoclostridium sp.]
MENIVELLYRSALQYPEQPCVVSASGMVTYREMLREVQSLMFTLYHEGVRRGERVIFYFRNSAEYIAAFFAVAALNAVAVPVNAANNIHHLQYIIDTTEPVLILVDNALMFGFSENSKNNTIKVRVLQSLVQWKREIDYVGNSMPNNTGNSAKTAMIIFTSGTSAMPKGVMLSHGNLLANTYSILDYLHLTHDDSVLVTIAFSYSYGNSLLLTHIASGGALYLENYAAFPVKVIKSLKSIQPTGFSTVGSYLNLLLKVAPLESLGFSALKYITFAGEATNYNMLLQLQRLYPELKIFVMYGQTEASARLSFLPCELLAQKTGSVGKGINNVELKVVNERGGQVAPGETGEILARGPNIMQGYWRDEQGTKSVIQNGWLHTGDIATVDRDGYIFIQGRNNDIIKYLGHRISPMEVESCIDKIPGVYESAVIETIHNGEVCIKAFVVTDGKVSTEMIHEQLRIALPSFKRPAIIRITTEIPRTANGKIKRAALREAELCVG